MWGEEGAVHSGISWPLPPPPPPSFLLPPPPPPAASPRHRPARPRRPHLNLLPPGRHGAPPLRAHRPSPHRRRLLRRTSPPPKKPPTDRDALTLAPWLAHSQGSRDPASAHATKWRGLTWTPFPVLSCLCSPFGSRSISTKKKDLQTQGQTFLATTFHFVKVI